MKDFQTEATQYYLPKAVLEEIPDQFMFYMKKHNIKPFPKIRKDPGDIDFNKSFVRENVEIDFEDEPPDYYSLT